MTAAGGDGGTAAPAGHSGPSAAPASGAAPAPPGPAAAGTQAGRRGLLARLADVVAPASGAAPARPGLTVRRARVDLGRLIMVPAALLILLIDVIALTRRPAAGAPGVLRLCDTILSISFYALIIWCYLRRRPAVATSTSVTAHVAAITGTLSPFAFPLLPLTAAGPVRQLAADIVLVAGLAWSLWALRSLGRSLSMVAQAREVVTGGPYRWIRHPLYTGELVSSLGLAILVGSPAAAGVWLAMAGLQVYRAAREEQVLLLALPAYRDYRSRTAALLPGVF